MKTVTRRKLCEVKEVKMGGHTQDYDLHCKDHGQCIIFMEGNGMAHDDPHYMLCAFWQTNATQIQHIHLLQEKRMKWQLHVITCDIFAAWNYMWPTTRVRDCRPTARILLRLLDWIHKVTALQLIWLYVCLCVCACREEDYTNRDSHTIKDKELNSVIMGSMNGIHWSWVYSFNIHLRSFMCPGIFTQYWYGGLGLFKNVEPTMLGDVARNLNLTQTQSLPELVLNKTMFLRTFVGRFQVQGFNSYCYGINPMYFNASKQTLRITIIKASSN